MNEPFLTSKGKRAAEGQKEDVVNFRCTIKEKRLLHMIAKKRNMSIADVIRDALRARYYSGAVKGGNAG